MNSGSGLEDTKHKGPSVLARANRHITGGRLDRPVLLLLAMGSVAGCTSDSDDARVTTADAGVPAPTLPPPMPSTETEGMPTASPDVTFGPGTVEVPEPTAPVAEPELPPGYEGPTADNPLVSCDEATAAGDDPLIDDFEGLSAELRSADGREGSWYPYDDGVSAASQEVTWAQDVPAISGTATLHVAGGPFSQYSGVGFGPRWSVLGPEFCTYDASIYDGLTFWARGTGTVRVGLQTPAVRPVALGGQCPADATCFDSYGKDFTITEEWTQHFVSFVEATQAGWGTPAAFDPAALNVVEFQFPPSTSYDIYIDDVAFFSGEPVPGTPPDGGVNPPAPMDGGTSDVPDAAVPDSDAGDAGDAGGSDLDAGASMDAG